MEYTHSTNHFNSHAHVERDQLQHHSHALYMDFNSHAHVERDIQVIVEKFMRLYFNSHAHVERDLIIELLEKDMQISTHTLTWSVTLDVVYIWCLLNVMRTYFFI